jgi:hypothetical protein
MMDKERWRIQNKLYHMKEKKIETELHLKEVQKQSKIFFEKNLLAKRDDETLYVYCIVILHIFLFNLDKVFDYYYLKIKSFLIIKRLKKVILTLTKEIKHYEQY